VCVARVVKLGFSNTRFIEVIQWTRKEPDSVDWDLENAAELALWAGTYILDHLDDVSFSELCFKLSEKYQQRKVVFLEIHISTVWRLDGV
jgi:hypothetical protein